jgi:branched-chain amino acid transport system ATP-binding protein
VFPGLTVRDHVALAAAGRWLVDAPRRRRDDVERALEAFPVLRERAAQPAVRLSEPERSALALAQAAAGCPRLILIDDPASRLPPVLADAALAFLGGLRDGGVSVLVADPPPYRALAFADRGYTLDGGTLAASGAGSALRRILGGADP